MWGSTWKRRHSSRWCSASYPLSAKTVPMRTRTAQADRNSRSNITVSLTLAAVATHATGTPSPPEPVEGHRDVIFGPLFAAVGGVGAGQIAAAFGPHRAAIQDQVRVTAQHRHQERMH